MTDPRHRAAMLAAILLTVGGCSLTPRSGPTASAILTPSEANASYDLLELTPATFAPFVIREPAALAVGQAGLGGGLTIAPGDTLRVVIFERSDGGTFAAPAAGGTVFQAVRVDEHGFIALPYAGRVRVAGSGLERASMLIRGALAGRVVDAQVHVELTASPSQSVLVSGEVRNPGRITTADGPLTLVDAVARAGGPRTGTPTRTLDVLLNAGGTVRRIPYSQVLTQAPTYLNRGDTVILEANVTHFTAMGAVTRQGLHRMVASSMSLLDGIAEAGGLRDNAASPGNVFIFRLRRTPGVPPRPLVLHLDLSKAESMFVAQRVALLPDDSVYVTNAPVYEVQKFIAPILRAMSVGATAAAL